MEDVRPTTADLLEAWRETIRAAELAERLAALASDAADQADRNALDSEGIADIAERASRAADRAAHKARDAAGRARRFAVDAKESRLRDAQASVKDTKTAEAAARGRYHSDGGSEPESA